MEEKKKKSRLPVHPVWDDGAAVGSEAVGVVAGYEGKGQEHNQEHHQGSRAPSLPTLKEG